MSSVSLKQKTHDARNALNVIMGNAQLLQDSSLTPEQQKYVARILHASREILATLQSHSGDASRTDRDGS